MIWPRCPNLRARVGGKDEMVDRRLVWKRAPVLSLNVIRGLLGVPGVDDCEYDYNVSSRYYLPTQVELTDS